MAAAPSTSDCVAVDLIGPVQQGVRQDVAGPALKLARLPIGGVNELANKVCQNSPGSVVASRDAKYLLTKRTHLGCEITRGRHGHWPRSSAWAAAVPGTRARAWQRGLQPWPAARPARPLRLRFQPPMSPARRLTCSP